MHNGMAIPPAWMATPDPHQLGHFTAKIREEGAAVANGGRELNRIKRTKPAPQRNVNRTRSRAQLPADPQEREKYELPRWASDAAYKSMMLTILKTSANTQQRLRQMEAIVADHYMIPSAIPAVAAALAQIDAYQKMVSKGPKPGGESHGAPGPQIAWALCNELKEQSNIGQEPKAQLLEHILTPISELPMEQAIEIVSTCSLKVCYDSAFYKLIFISHVPKARLALRKSLTSLTGVKHFTGPAPASGQEDEIQKWIEMMESMER